MRLKAAEVESNITFKKYISSAVRRNAPQEILKYGTDYIGAHLYRPNSMLPLISFPFQDSKRNLILNWHWQSENFHTLYDIIYLIETINCIFRICSVFLNVNEPFRLLGLHRTLYN